MSQTDCQTASVDQTAELSQAVGQNTTIDREAPTTIGNESLQKTESTGQLVLWELGRQQVTVDFSAGNIVTDTGLLAVRKLDRELGILAEAAARLDDPRLQKFVIHDVERVLVQQVYQLLGGYLDPASSSVVKLSATAIGAANKVRCPNNSMIVGKRRR